MSAAFQLAPEPSGNVADLACILRGGEATVEKRHVPAFAAFVSLLCHELVEYLRSVVASCQASGHFGVAELPLLRAVRGTARGGGPPLKRVVTWLDC